jgi:alpha-D-ribose 1-methylphosphonate 5-triphosphate synthase subunit PhnG
MLQLVASENPERREWMGILSRAPLEMLEHWHAGANPPAHRWVRRPETGLVMVRARAGGTGGRFNLGQMTVTRCALRLLESAADGDTETGIVGLGYVQGRSKRHAELAAVFDALLQDEARRGVLEGRVIAPLEAAHAERRDARSRKANSTKVNFFTLVRGENDRGENEK